jgi:large subunit ribosomal protein L24
VISNVMIMCNKCVSPTRIKIHHLEDGKKIRLCVKCGEAIDT